jgi:lipid A 3-O-deacylase
VSYKKTIPLLFLTFLTFCLAAQTVNNTASFRTINNDSYCRLHYENDYFGGTDKYYTQGINFEIASPFFSKTPIHKFLLGAKENTLYGLSIEHNGYTPTSITDSLIRNNDRPYAGVFFLKFFSIYNKPEKHLRAISSLSLGIIGSAAGGEEMQKTIHRRINDRQPRGWQYQIKNDLVLNYEIGIEKNILRSKKYFLLNGFANARAGTLNDKLSTGFVLMIGKINSAITTTFSANENNDKSATKEKFTFHMYMQPIINMVGYDATMQGGIFTKNNVYTIPSNNIERITFEGNVGIVLKIEGIYLEYFLSRITKEFSAGLSHNNGGIRIGWKF